MRPFAIAAMQLDIPEGNSHLDQVIEKIRHTARRFPWIEMVVLSELAAGYKRADATTLPGPVENKFRALAEELGLWIIPGSFYELSEGKIYNTTPVIDPNGDVLGRYRKMFPFYPYEAGVTAGEAPFVFDVPSVGRFGVSICYDMWFPETTRWLAAMGAEVIIHPTLTDTIDRDVEFAIVRAAAAQNQCFVIDVNGVGHGGNGRSCIVGPAGDVLHQAGTAEQEIPIEIDLDRVSRSREVGLRGLGQPLKSFRDRAFEFPHYAPGARFEALDRLGPLELPQRGTTAGLRPKPKDLVG